MSGIDDKVGLSEVVSDAPTPGTAVSKNGVGWHCAVCDCYLKDSAAYLDHINGKKHQRALGYSMRVEKQDKSQVMAKLREVRRSKSRSDELREGNIMYVPLTPCSSLLCLSYVALSSLSQLEAEKKKRKAASVVAERDTGEVSLLALTEKPALRPRLGGY